MTKTMKPISLLACSLVLLCLGYAPGAPLKIQFLPDAQAIIGVAPGGSVVRRRAIVGTAAVASTTAQATASANASAAAAAEANAAAANANAAAAAAATPAPAPAGPPAVGSIVTTLPPGCVAETLNNIAYQRCGSTYYTTAMMGNNLVFVVAQP